jgi:hypothetical protein
VSSPERIQPAAIVTQPGLLALQRDMIRMLEGALKFYAPDAPELNKLQEMRDAIGKAK